jgi:hypothetical protein
MQLSGAIGVLLHVTRNMSATTKLKSGGIESDASRIFRMQAVQPEMLVRFGVRVKPTEQRCPACDAIVYARRHKDCGACGRTLPAACRFTSEEAQRVNNLFQRERQQHRDWLRKTDTV